MPGILFLILATIFVVLLIVSVLRSNQYASMVENLNSDDHPFKDFYTIGFYLNSTKLFRLRGKLGKQLKKDAKLVWDNLYYEYYANLAWARFLTVAVIVIPLGLIFAGFQKDTSAAIMILAIAGLVLMAFWNILISNIKESVQKRKDACEAEFPNMVSKLSLLINSGMVLREAWYVVARGKEGPLYELMEKACQEMDNGVSDQGAIYKFGVLSDSSDIKKFTSSLIQGLEKGNSELADFLLAQTSELWAHKRQVALQKGEVAAGKLIIPLGITFAGIIMIVVSAAMQSMSF